MIDSNIPNAGARDGEGERVEESDFIRRRGSCSRIINLPALWPDESTKLAKGTRVTPSFAHLIVAFASFVSSLGDELWTLKGSGRFEFAREFLSLLDILLVSFVTS